MFIIDSSMRRIEASPEQILSLHESVNQPHVGVPGKQNQPTQAYIVEVREEEGFFLYVYLWLSRSREGAIYRSGAVPQAEVDEMRREAVNFCESMGFIMEEIPYDKLEPGARVEVLARLPPFQLNPSWMADSLGGVSLSGLGASAAGSQAGSEDPAATERLGRFLASF